MTASPANVILTYPATGTVTHRITIATTRVEEIWNKMLTLITQPKSDKEKDIDNGANTTKMIDLLLKAERRWAIDGYISTGLGSTDTHDNVTDKRDDLRKLFFVGETFDINIEGTEYEVNSDKMAVTWEPADEDPITKYLVKFTVVKGEKI